MFNFLKKKAAAHTLASPCNGNAVKMTEVNDPTFSAEMLGKDPATVSKWVTNTSQPSLENLIEIARCLKCEINDLVRT